MCHHGSSPHHALHGAELREAVREAARRCAASGEELTRPRQQVLELLLAAGEPVKAYDLLAAYPKTGKGAFPTTVYRALEFLTRMRFAHRVESMNAYVSCSLHGEAHVAGFLICDCCGAAQEFEPNVAADLAAATSAGYAVQTVTLEAHGLCAACRA
jgi:Fur family zinc uptake transcriptional regulator